VARLRPSGALSRRDAQTEELYASALAEDASVFDYDGVYDQMKASKGVRCRLSLSSASPLTLPRASAGLRTRGAGGSRSGALHRAAAGCGEGARTRGGRGV